MNDAAPMGLLERIGELGTDSQGLSNQQRTACETCGQGLALEVLHNEIVSVVLVPNVV